MKLSYSLLCRALPIVILFGVYMLIAMPRMALAVVPLFASVDHNVQPLQAQINLLQAQVSAILGEGEAVGGAANPPVGDVAPSNESSDESLVVPPTPSSPPICITQTLRRGSVDALTNGQVSILQKILGVEVTGNFGRTTEQAVKSFQAKNGIVASGGADTTGYGVVSSLTRKFLNPLECRKPPKPRKEITVLSPNGGERWEKGTIQKIAWRFRGQVGCDVEPCPQVGAGIAPVSLRLFDIYLLPYRQPCVGGGCPVALTLRYTLARRVSGTVLGEGSFLWTVGKTVEGKDVPDGTYYVRVQQLGTKQYDDSDAPFLVISKPVSSGTLRIDPASLSLSVSEKKQVKAYYNPSVPLCVSGAPCPVPAWTEVDAMWSSSNPAVADFVYAVLPCPPPPPLPLGSSTVPCKYIKTVFVVGKSSGVAEIKAVYTPPGSGGVLVATAKVSVGTSGITVLSPNGGETLIAGQTYQIRWTTSGVEANQKVQIGLRDIRYDPNLDSGEQTLVYSMDNTKSYFWAVPQQPMNGGGINVYKIIVYLRGTEGIADSSDAPFSIVGSTNLPPTISGVSGPTVLKVGEVGNWTIKASDPENGPLSYSVVWGDGDLTPPPLPTPFAATSVQQITTFTHAYAKAGSFVPTFSVTDNGGLTATSSISVVVGGGIPPPISVQVTASQAQPLATIAPHSTIIPFTAITISPTSPIIINDITIERVGLSSDYAFKYVALMTNVPKPNAGVNYAALLGKIDPTIHRAILTNQWGGIKIDRPTDFVVAGIMQDDLAQFAGQVAYFDVVKMTYTVPGGSMQPITLAIRGTGQTLNNSLQVGSVTISKSSPAPYALSNTSYTFSNTSIENVVLNNFITQASDGGIALNGIKYACTALNNGTPQEICYLKEAVVLPKGTTYTVGMTSGALLDANIVGVTYGYQIPPNWGPVVKDRSFSVNLSSDPKLGNIIAGANNQILATFTVAAAGEAFAAKQINFKLNGTGSTSNIANSFQLYDAQGHVVAGPKDATSDGMIFFTDQVVFPSGVSTYTLRGNISNGAPDGATISISTNPANDWGQVVGQTSGAAITPTPNTIMQGTVFTISKGSWQVSLDSSNPAETMFPAGSIRVPVAVLRFSAINENIALTNLRFQIKSPAGAGDAKSISLWDGATMITSKTVPAFTNGVEDFVFYAGGVSSFIIPRDSFKIMTVKIDLASIGGTVSGKAGQLVAIDYDGDGSGLQKNVGVGLSSGNSIPSSTTLDTASAGIRYFKSIPTVSRIAVPSTTLTAGNRVLYRFNISANSASDIALEKVTFQINTNGATVWNDVNPANFKLNVYSDTNLTTSTIMDVQKGDQAFVTKNTINGKLILQMRANTGYYPGQEVVIPAGTSRIFELIADIPVGVSSPISTTLLGDSKYPFASGMGAFEEVAASSSGNFIWSDLSGSVAGTHSLTSKDWTNGYAVPGLPSFGLVPTTLAQSKNYATNVASIIESLNAIMEKLRILSR
ncbi:MAG: peptidoglycan-binding protein [Candidatus Colwellbacteria bacterium]|nr:peptidoglycan-binding protein [Candidatus Colwellbacteria bacterium]